MKPIVALGFTAIVLFLPAVLASAEEAATQQTPAPPSQSEAQTLRRQPLDPVSSAAVLQALDTEREGIAFYSAVIRRHGSIRPFVQIIAAERRHEAELLALARRFSLDAPAPADGRAQPVAPESVKECCEAAVQWERQTALLLNELSRKAMRPGVKSTLVRVAMMARDRHMPAFQRCVDLGGSAPEKAAAPPVRAR